MSISADAIAAVPVAQALANLTVKVPRKRNTIATAEPMLVPQAH